MSGEAPTSGPVLDPPPPAILWLLRVGAVIALAAAVVGTFTRDDVSRAAGGVAVGVIVAVPLLRVLLLGTHWGRRHDLRFAVAALGLLAVAGSGALLALWTA